MYFFILTTSWQGKNVFLSPCSAEEPVRSLRALGAHPRARKQAVAEWRCHFSHCLEQHGNHSIFLLSCSKEIGCSSFFLCCDPPSTSTDQAGSGVSCREAGGGGGPSSVGDRPLLWGMEEQMILPAALIKKLISFISSLRKGQCWA